MIGFAQHATTRRVQLPGDGRRKMATVPKIRSPRAARVEARETQADLEKLMGNGVLGAMRYYKAITPELMRVAVQAFERGSREIAPAFTARARASHANELIELLANGGLELVAMAEDPRYEDTFLLGPGLPEQLKSKVRIMREHWLDVQDYLAPPHK